MAYEGPSIPTGSYDLLTEVKGTKRHLDNIERAVAQRETDEIAFLAEVLQRVEDLTGRLEEWQRFHIIAVVSGRGVEWSQTRGSSHYHLVGVPCTICGRS